LWKFSQLLTCLEALRAQVSLDCVIGSYRWELRPKANCHPIRQVATFVGEPWVITSAPEHDFSIDPDWLRECEQNQQYDPATDRWLPYRWERFVERMPQETG
jgi:hypothetical protein